MSALARHSRVARSCSLPLIRAAIARFYRESDASSLLKITLEQTARYCGNLRSACCPIAERSGALTPALARLYDRSLVIYVNRR